MNNKRATKRALLTSVTALVMCVVMLVGTTFAWFTDTASTGVNKIVAGNLDVALEMKNPDYNSTDSASKEWISAEGKTLQFKKAAGAPANEQVLWEPGCRYELPQLRVVNKGNLALKYKIQITGIQGDAKLNEVIDWTINDAAINLTEEHLSAGQTGAAFTIKGHMQETAGNEYQDLTIDGIGITVFATQDTVENDSFGPDYDANARYYSDEPAVVDGGSATFTGNIAGDGAWGVIQAKNGAQVSINANVSAEESEDRYAMAVWAIGLGTKVTISGGNFTQEITGTDPQYDMIYASGGAKIVITGGTFKIGGGDPKWTLNCQDNSGSTITVMGGSFYKFDPSAPRANQEDEVIVPDTCEVIKSGDWYTVVPKTVSSQDDLNSAINNGATGAVGVKLPTNTTITLDNGIANSSGSDNKARDITFVGDGTQTVDVITNAVSAEGGMLNYQRGSTFTFENMTIQAGEGTYDGIVCDELTYKNCTIKGKLTLYGKATFINCTFENTMANQYSIWTWGGTDVTFEGCTFNTNGKAILLFGEEKTTNLTVNNCVFNDRNNGAAGKAAIEIGEAHYGKHNNFTVVINGSTVASGFAVNSEGTSTNSKLWANKNSMDATHLSVTIDGTKIQ